mgnify:CR=1 FL=1
MAASNRQLAALTEGLDYGPAPSQSRALLGELRPRERAVFLLRAYGMTWREITAVMRGDRRGLQRLHAAGRARIEAILLARTRVRPPVRPRD